MPNFIQGPLGTSCECKISLVWLGAFSWQIVQSFNLLSMSLVMPSQNTDSLALSCVQLIP